MVKLSAIAAATIAAFCAASVANAGRPDPVAGGEKAKGMCATCHGLDGVGPVATHPNLKGQKVKYLIKQLENFRSGERQGPQGLDPEAHQLTDDDIKDLAAYFSGLSDAVGVADPNPPAPAPGAEKAKVICAVCHGLDGISLVAAYPNLRGQKVEYMIEQLENFRSGERKSLQLMNPVASQLTDDEIEDLAAHFSSLGGESDGGEAE